MKWEKKQQQPTSGPGETNFTWLKWLASDLCPSSHLQAEWSAVEGSGLTEAEPHSAAESHEQGQWSLHTCNGTYLPTSI